MYAPRDGIASVGGMRTLVPINTKPNPAMQWDLLQSCASHSNTGNRHQHRPSINATHHRTSSGMSAVVPPAPPVPPYPCVLMTPRNSSRVEPQSSKSSASGTSSQPFISHARALSSARIPPPPPPPQLKIPPPPPPPPPASPRISFDSSSTSRNSSSSTSSNGPTPTPRHVRLTSETPITPTHRSSFQAGRSQPPPVPMLNIDHARSPSQSMPIKILPPPLPANLNSASNSNTNLTNSIPMTPRKLPPPLPRATCGSDPLPPQTPSSNADAKAIAATRAKIEGEILSTEASYLSNLQHFVSEFITPLRTRIRSGKKEDSVGDLDEEGLNRIAGNIETITNFHAAFHAELSSEFARATNTTPPNLAKVFLKYAEYFKMYTAYLNSYETCVVQMEELRENEKFQRFVKEFMMKQRRSSQLLTSPPLQSTPTPTPKAIIGGFSLIPPSTPSSRVSPAAPASTTNANAALPSLAPMDYIIQPVQRLPRYVLLLQQLLKHSREQDQKQIQQALSSMESMTSFVNERKRSVEAMQKLLEIANEISGELPQEIKPLIQPFRKLLKEGTLQVITERNILGVGLGTVKSSACIVRLFNDLLLWTNTSNKFKGYLDLNTTGVIQSSQDELCFQVSDSHATIWVRATGPEETKQWREAIEATIKALQQEKDATRRRQRVAKARSTNHTHRTQLRAIITDGLFQLPGNSLEQQLEADKQTAAAIAADPQLQSDWLEKEAAAQRERDRASSSKSSEGDQARSSITSPPVGAFLPKELIAQLKLQQLQLGSNSTCTTAPNSTSSSRQVSRRPSGQSTNTPISNSSNDTSSHDRSASHSRSLLHQHSTSMSEE